jgi:hypothetical protein
MTLLHSPSLAQIDACMITARGALYNCASLTFRFRRELLPSTMVNAQAMVNEFFGLGWRLVVEKAFVAKRVAVRLRNVEQSIDSAMAEASETVVDLLRARKEWKLAPNIGDLALAKLTEATMKLSEAHAAMIAAHYELKVAQDELGIRTNMAGLQDGPSLWLRPLGDELPEVKRNAS